MRREDVGTLLIALVLTLCITLCIIILFVGVYLALGEQLKQQEELNSIYVAREPLLVKQFKTSKHKLNIVVYSINYNKEYTFNVRGDIYKLPVIGQSYKLKKTDAHYELDY